MVSHSISAKVIEYKSKNKLCEAEACLHPARTRNLCPMHYQRLRRHGDPEITHKPRASSSREVPIAYRCYVDGCTRMATTLRLCPAHYQRWRRNGSVDILKHPGRPRSRDGRPVDICESPECPNVARIHGLCMTHNRSQMFCRESDCGRPHLKGQIYCAIHYTPETCLEPNCEYEQYTGGRCRKHHRQAIRRQETLDGRMIEPWR